MTEKSKLGILDYRQLPQFAITTIADANCRVGHLLQRPGSSPAIAGEKV